MLIAEVLKDPETLTEHYVAVAEQSRVQVIAAAEELGKLVPALSLVASPAVYNHAGVLAVRLTLARSLLPTSVSTWEQEGFPSLAKLSELSDQVTSGRVAMEQAMRQQLGL